MSDTGARPREKSSKNPCSLKEDIVSLEKEESMLKEQLDSLTPIQIPISSERDQILQERERLQKLLEEHRESAETAHCVEKSRS
ncbi:hypothetical protein DPMN_192336 [Dreissena polymorpha]|uniref:Uncharacterized protein n=1 Tax=Dreissena polymorpha TaxID=45954 RepID=A0A9D3Y3V4_DREPO|nr:hypothetical protein DPMN_192336 [Dreissena polymorpha]